MYLPSGTFVHFPLPVRCEPNLRLIDGRDQALLPVVTVSRSASHSSRVGGTGRGSLRPSPTCFITPAMTEKTILAPSAIETHRIKLPPRMTHTAETTQATIQETVRNQAETVLP